MPRIAPSRRRLDEARAALERLPVPRNERQRARFEAHLADYADALVARGYPQSTIVSALSSALRRLETRKRVEERGPLPAVKRARRADESFEATVDRMRRELEEEAEARRRLRAEGVKGAEELPGPEGPPATDEELEAARRALRASREQATPEERAAYSAARAVIVRSGRASELGRAAWGWERLVIGRPEDAGVIA